MAQTLKELRSEAFLLGGDDVEERIPPALIDLWINEGARLYLERTERKMGIYTATFADDAQTSVLTTWIGKMKRAWQDNADEQYDVVDFELEELYFRSTISTPTGRKVIARSGGSLYISPVISGGDDIYVLCVQPATALASDSDELDDETDPQAVIAHAMYKVFIRMANPQMAQLMMAEYEMHVRSGMAQGGREQRDTGPMEGVR